MHSSSSPKPSTPHHLADPSATILFHQSQLKLLLEDIGERYTVVVRRIIAILDGIEDGPGPNVVSRTDMLDSFRKA